MIKRVDHIAVAVRDLKESRKKIEALYGGEFIVEGVNPEGQYKVALFRVGESYFSMLESTSPEGFVAKHIERYGETIQHMGVEVDDIDKFIKHLHSQGMKTSGYTEVEGVRKEVLVGARNPLGVILQVIEWLGDYKKISQEVRMTKVWG